MGVIYPCVSKIVLFVLQRNSLEHSQLIWNDNVKDTAASTYEYENWKYSEGSQTSDHEIFCNSNKFPYTPKNMA